MLEIQNPDGSSQSFETRAFTYTGALSQPYILDVEVLDINNQLLGQDILLCKASLQFVGSSGNSESISGLITAVSQETDAIQQKTVYHITIEPYLAMLSTMREIKVHHRESYLEIAESIINQLSQAYGLTDYADFQITMPWLVSPLSTHDVEFADSKLAYFNQILNFTRYFFLQGGAGENLVVVDRPMLLPTREQTITFDAMRKEDLKDGTPSIYSFIYSKKAQNLAGQPFYFDPKNTADSLQNLRSQNPLVVEASLYAPESAYALMKMKLTEMLNHDIATYTFKGYYSDLWVGERILVQAANGGSEEVFIESLRLEGHYQNEAWRFEVSGVARPYSPTGEFLGPYLPRQKLPAVLPGAILQETNQVNDEGYYQVKFPQGFDVGDVTPTVSVREIQETVTSGGGASHSMSGTANIALITQDGLPHDLLMMGSLIDNKRPSHIGAESYREAGIQTGGGLKMHMRRSDGNNSYSEMGMNLKDAQGNPAHITMGANSQTLSEQGDRAHGIQMQSTGYAKRVVSGNDYDTVGDPNNPVTQKSLVNQNGQTVHATQTNVANGNYSQSYYTEQSGVKVNNAPAQPKTLPTNSALKHYFYVVPQTIDLNDLANQLYSAENLNQAKALFTQINLQAYGNSLGAGTWAYIPMANQQYQAGDIVNVTKALQQVEDEQDAAEEDLFNYSVLHHTFSVSLDNLMTFANGYFNVASSTINSLLQQIDSKINEIGSLKAQDPALAMGVNGAVDPAVQSQVNALSEEVDTYVKQLIQQFGQAEPALQSSFKADTGLEWNRDVLGLKATGLTDSDIANLVATKQKGIAMAGASKGLGILGLTLGSVENAENAALVCQKYGEGSKMCFKAYGAAVGGVAIGELGSGAGTDASTLLICNTIADPVSGPAGFIGCTIATAAGAIAGGVAGSKLGLELGSSVGASYYSIYSQKVYLDGEASNE